MNSVTFEIDSCQWLHEQTRMLESSMCSACKDLGRYGRKYYRDHEIPTTGVCHKLYPHLAPAPVADQENIGICNQDRNEEERATRSARSGRMTKKPYTAGPANDANMFCGSQIDSASMDEKRKDQTKRKLLKDLIAIQGQDEEGLYEVLERFMGNVAARMVPNILEIVRKTTPAAPALNEEQINTQRWQHLRKELQSMKSCDKKGHAALVADQIEDHRIAEMILPKVLDKVRSTTPGKIKVAEAFVQGGARLNLGGRGVSRSSFNKKKVAVAKVRQAVKRSVGTPIFRAMLDATTPTIPKGKPPRRENTISAPNFDAAANAPRIVRTPLETITNIPIPGTLHPNTPVPETPVAQQDFTPSDSPSSRQELDDAYFEAQLYSPTSPEARTPSCMESCCSPDDRRNTTTKRRRVSFGRVAYCSPVAEEASADSMMLDEPPLASRIPERSPEPSESSEFNLDPIVDDIVDDNSPASASNDADPIVVETVLEEEDEESEAASSDPMMLDDTPHAPPITARSPEPSESSEFNSDPIVDFNSDPIADANSPASASNHTDPIVVETVLEEQDEEYEAASSDSMMLDETPQASLVTARSLESSESNSDPMTNGMSPASSDPTPVATSLPRSPPKDGRQPNRSAHLPVVQSPPRRTKKRKATLTFEKKQELCKEELGEQIISHLAKNKGTWKARDRRPFLAAVAHHEKKVIEKVVGVKINAGEYKNIRIHAKYPGSFVDARKPRVFRNKIKKELLLKLLHHLDDPGNLQRLAVGRQMVEIMGGQQCVELDNVTRNKTCAILAAEFIVKLGEELDEMVVAEDGTFQPLPESAERCQCLETGTGRRCMKMCGHDKRPENGSGEEDETDPKHYRHKYTPPGSISFTTAMELVDTLTGEDLKALSGLDDIKVAKGMENFKRQREIADLYFSGAGKDQMKQRIDDHELFCQTDFVPHLQEVSENKCNCLTCGFCNEDDPEDVVCPDADKHKPSCTKCAEGFAITHDIKACITDTIAVFKTRNKVGPTSSSSPSSDDSSSGANYADDCGETSAESSSSDGTPQHDGDGVATWEKKSSAILKTELRRRGEKVSGKVGELRERLVASDKARAARERRDAETSHLSPAALAELEQHEEYLHAIDECTTNLREYRSHLSRHVSEEKYATEKLENLADDEAVITCDYKMKILSCFFREAQSKWFGKRGVSCLGFMIATNAEDEADRAKGVKDVKFVMMFTDDGLQDDWQIACAKHTIYNDHLPSQIKKVLFTSDGAGCFKSKLHRAIQPFWKHWTGVDEIELRITPAGDGKSCLDGMFGRLTYVLHGSVDQGNSYFDAESILKAIQDSNGLSATTFLGFHAVRANQLKADLELDGRLESVLLSVLDPNRDATDHSIQLFKHSGYGKWVKVDLATQSSFSRYEVNKNNEGETTDDDWISKAYNQDGTLNTESLDKMLPVCTDLQDTRNAKENNRSRLARKGEGANHPKVRREKKSNRMKAKVATLEDEEIQERDRMVASGLHLCFARCPATGRYCRKVFMLESGLEKHRKETAPPTCKACHDFPSGITAKDWITLEAGKAGGALAAGGRPDKLSDSLFEVLVAAVEGCPGEVDARCKAQFHRKENGAGYRKPEELNETLNMLYAKEPKLTARQMRDEMSKMRDAKGGLKFSFAKRDTTGMLLSVDQIQSFISTSTQKKKKVDKANGVRSEKDVTEDRMVQEVVDAENS